LSAVAPSSSPYFGIQSNGPDPAMAISTDGLTKYYGDEGALKGVCLQVPEGSVYVLVGPNGAGKSTAFKILLDLVRPDSGEVRVFGRDPRSEGPTVRAQIGYVPERADWGYGWMSVGRLLRHHRTFFPNWDDEYAAELARAFDLKENRRFGTLSKGQMRRVQLVLALAHRPRLLLLDEPSDGLDPVMLQETLGMIAAHLSETTTTTLISTHRVHEVERLADYLGVIRSGRLIAQTPRDLLHRSLRRYRAEVPDSWEPPAPLSTAVVRRSGFGRELHLVVWGEETEVIAALATTGAVVRDVSALSLEEAALGFLSHGDRA
jgi:ABC-2 type transport system ATP-binding protein